MSDLWWCRRCMAAHHRSLCPREPKAWSRRVRDPHKVYPVSPADRRAVKARRTCEACGVQLGGVNGAPGEVDHIVPLSRGGRSELDNLQHLCQRCHAAKSRRERRL